MEFLSLVYTASLSRDEDGYWRHDKEANFLKDYEGDEITLRYNPSNIVYILVYTREKNGQPSEYLCMIRARDLEEERLSLKEWEDRKDKIRLEGKAIDQSSILAQQRDLYKDSLKQAKTLKGQRKKEQQRITGKSKQSNIVPFSEKSPPKNKKNGESDMPTITSLLVEGVESIQEQPQIQVRPALFVVPDCNEFMEDDW